MLNNVQANIQCKVNTPLVHDATMFIPQWKEKTIRTLYASIMRIEIDQFV